MRIFRIGANHRKVGEPFERNLFGMGGTGDDAQLLEREVVMVVHILHDGGVVVRDDAFDGRDDEFLLERNGQRFERLFQVGRGAGQDDDVGLGNHPVEIVRGVYARAVEPYVAQIAGIATLVAQAFEHLRIADVPTYRGFVFGQYLGERRGPASVSDHGASGAAAYLVVHKFSE